jgi:hypothetical protein
LGSGVSARCSSLLVCPAATAPASSSPLLRLALTHLARALAQPHSRCRMLLLLCDGCGHARRARPAAAAAPALLCELCVESGRGGRGCSVSPSRATTPVPEAAAAGAAGAAVPGCGAPGLEDGACSGSGEAARPGTGARRLRILCLHGFRQSGRQFEVNRGRDAGSPGRACSHACAPVLLLSRALPAVGTCEARCAVAGQPPTPSCPPPVDVPPKGRTHALRRRLADVAEFVFADGPHVLPLLMTKQSSLSVAADEPAADAAPCCKEREELRGAGGGSLGAAAQPEQLAPGAAWPPHCDDHDPSPQVAAAHLSHAVAAARSVGPDALEPHERSRRCARGRRSQAARGPHATAAAGGPSGAPASGGPGSGAPRRAWLVAPGQYTELYGRPYGVGDGAGPGPGAGEAERHLGEQEQHSRQTSGWAPSLAAVRAVLAQWGPFDGVLGFSQVGNLTRDGAGWSG